MTHRLTVGILVVIVPAVVAMSFRNLIAETKEDRAADLASRGVTLFQEGRYREALLLFLESYSHAKIPEVVWNIARCYEELGDLGSASRFFEEFLPLAPDEDARRKALARIEQVHLRIAASGAPAKAETALVVSAEGVNVREARIVVDGREVYSGPLPAKVPVEPGRRHVQVLGGEAVEAVTRLIEFTPAGIEVVVLRPPRPSLAPQMAGHATDTRYCDPFLFPSSRMGFAVGGEISPVFVRGDPFGGDQDMPIQTFAGVFAQAGGKDFAVTLRAGRWSRVPSWLLYPEGSDNTGGMVSWNLHKPFERAGLELKVRTSVSQTAWSTLVFDMDYRHIVLSVLEEPEDFYSLQFLLAEGFGFAIKDRVALEFWLGLAFLVPQVDDSKRAKQGLAIAFPMAGRVSVRIVHGGHVVLEARWPVTIGPMDPPEGGSWSRGAGMQADMALGYRHIFGNYQVGGAIVFALNRSKEFGREKAWLLLTGQYQF